jgi:hypothetical protein
VRKKYDTEYINYIESGESAAVFIVRDIVNSINTKGKWIDIVSMDGYKNDNDQWEFESFEIELFPRKTTPNYANALNEYDKRYLTWLTAHNDIKALREENYKGTRFKICPNLVNLNRGKYRIVEGLWNKKFERWVPMKWKTSSCEIKKRKLPLKPKLKYFIRSIERL